MPTAMTTEERFAQALIDWRPYEEKLLYALEDQTGVYFYVGRTWNLELRLSQHVTFFNAYRDIPKVKIIHEIGRAGGVVRIRLIEEVNSANKDYGELWWIGEFVRRGVKLTNSENRIADGLKVRQSNKYVPVTKFEDIRNHKFFDSQPGFPLSKASAREKIAAVQEKGRLAAENKIIVLMNTLNQRGLITVMDHGFALLKKNLEE